MIFPLDVNKVVVNSNKMTGENKTQAIIVVFVLVSLIAFFGIDYVLGTTFGCGLGVTVVIYLILVIIAGILFFRFIIFDEELKKKEFEGAESDSFAKYMWLRSDVHTDTIIGKETVSVFEYTNGSAMCVMEFRFGSNDDDRAEITRRVNEQIIHVATENNLEIRIIDAPENFKNSAEFRGQIAAINAIKDKDAAKNVMIINDAIMEESYRLCNVDIVYVMLRTISNCQRNDIEIALHKIFSILQQNITAYRSIHFLNAEDLMEFYREFYKIAAIDLSMMRTMELAQQITDEFDNIVSLMQLKTISGRIFSTGDNIFELNERKVN